MKMKIAILALALAVLLVMTSAAVANGDLEIPRWVLSGGASESSAGDLSLHATLGQPFVGVVSGEEVILGQGFWYGGAVTMDHQIYLPFVSR